MTRTKKTKGWTSFLALFLFSSCAPSPVYLSADEGNGRSDNDKTYTGVASYYADKFHGKKTANGEKFDMNALTAAHRTFPFGTKLRVTNLDNQKSVVLRINDRGPFAKGRLIDVSLAAAKQLDMLKTGAARVRLDILEWGSK